MCPRAAYNYTHIANARRVLIRDSWKNTSFYAAKCLCSCLSQRWKWGLATWRFGARSNQNKRVEKQRQTPANSWSYIAAEKRGNIEEIKRSDLNIVKCSCILSLFINTWTMQNIKIVNSQKANKIYLYKNIRKKILKTAALFFHKLHGAFKF